MRIMPVKQVEGNEMKPIERPQSMSGEVASRIREAIISGDLGLGEEVSERQLAERLGVSKTPVREALAQRHVAAGG